MKRGRMLYGKENMNMKLYLCNKSILGKIIKFAGVNNVLMFYSLIIISVDYTIIYILSIRLQKTKIGIKSFKRKRGFRENFMVAV